VLKRLDELFNENPMYGGLRLQAMLKREGILVGRHRIRRLMSKLGLWAVGPKPDTSKPHTEHKVYPYLLRGMEITQPNQVWATDITYIRMRHGFHYLCAIMDLATRKVLSWRLSNTPASDFCTAALKEAIARYGPPIIFNTDQGSQFTSAEFTGVLNAHGIQISMDGRGRCHENKRSAVSRADRREGEARHNIFVERLWWTIKHEWVYLCPCDTGAEQRASLAACVDWYNRLRPHQSLAWQTPDEVYFGALSETQKLAA